MNKHAIYHRPESNFCFAIDEKTVVLRIRFAKGDKIESLSVLYNSKYDIAKTQYRAKMPFICCVSLHDYYSVTLKLSDPRLAYVFEFSSDGKKYYFCEAGVKESYDFSLAYYDSFQYAYINKNDIIQNIEWLNNAVFYQVFIDRFDKASKKDESYINASWGDLPTPKSFFGGDLDGICRHLDYIQELGVTALYLNPIFKSPSNHKYDIIDYYEIDEMFGGEEAFGRLVKACHERGIKIMLDAVFNHVSEGFHPFSQVMELGNRSDYFDWFVIDGDKINPDRDNYDCFAACKFMPKLNTNNPEVQSYLINVAKHYITEYDIDGWRLDVADEVSHDFWRQLRREIKAVNPDAVLIGENWHNSESFLQGDQFDSIMNYGVTKAFLDFFAREIIDEKGFAEALNAQLMRYTDTTNNMMFNLLDCHDTHRFYSEVGCDARKLMRALLTLVFLPGSINLYYGTEILTEGGYDPDSRRTFDFEKLNNSEIKCIKGEIAYILKLKNQPAIAHGSIRIWSGDGYVTIERKCEEQTLTLKICSKNYTIEGEML
ncbi:MAG: alpha-glycosidase [Clostridia bacterium]|nr:alpha-glycosidase [Clostridia bacterium]